MKNYLLGVLLTCGALSVSASPLFKFTGGSLNVDAVGAAYSDYTANAGKARLDVGESKDFTFGSVDIIGVGAGDLTLSVDFSKPAIDDEVSVTGPFSVWSGLFFKAGNWEGGSTQFDYTWKDYTGQATLQLDNIYEKDLFSYSNSFDFTGSITNDSMTKVPEPASIALLGFGLLALGFRNRKRLL